MGTTASRKSGSLSRAYVASPSTQYHEAVTRCALRCKAARPAIAPGDVVPTFNPFASAAIVSELFGLNHHEVMEDIIELMKRV
jgi:hypothetical protein